DLEQKKDDAKEIIDSLPNLTDEEKDQIKQEIDDAKTEGKIDRIVEEAKELDEERQKAKDLEQKKDDAKEIINNLPNLADEEKAEFEREIDGAKTEGKIDRIVEEAREQDAENLAKAQEEAREEINNLPDLNDQEKGDFIDQVNDATTIDE